MRLKALIILAVFLSLSYPALCQPVIENLTINPQNLWLGESAYVSLICSIENSTVNSVYASITGPNMTVPELEFQGSGPAYYLTVDNLYLYSIGEYGIKVFCASGSYTANKSSVFTVSELTGSINSIKPDPAYVGDIIEIYVSVKKDGTELKTGVNFTLYLEGQQQQLKISPIYDTAKGWILKIDSPVIPGNYDIQVNATYGRASIIRSGSFEIKSDTEFDIISMDKTTVKPGDDLYIGLRAAEKGTIISVNKTNLKIEIGSFAAEIESITLSGNTFGVKLKVPQNDPGKYDLKASIDYKNNTLTTTEKIDYLVHVSGKFLDSSNKAISVNLKFFINGYEKLNLYTDSSGSYSGYITADKYDVHIIFPESTLILEDTFIDEFDDPILYYIHKGLVTPGIASYAVYVYEVAIPFNYAEIEMRYNEGDTDETELELFKCNEWSHANKACKNDNWIETNTDIDTAKNAAIIRTGTLSAFALGSREKIALNFNLNKASYSLREPMTISGITQDSRNNPISNVSLAIGIKNTNIIKQVYSDNNGVFRLDFIGPDQEGNYTVYIRANRQPFLPSQSETSVDVKKSVALSILFPDSIKIRAGENLTQEIRLVNTGQTEINNININLSGVPETYYSIGYYSDSLSVGEEKALQLYFFIPADAKQDTTAANIKAEGSGITREKTFGFTIEPKREAQPANQTGSITGFAIDFSLLQLNETIYLILFAIASFSLAFALKKRKKTDQRLEIRNTLSEIRDNLKKPEPEIAPAIPSSFTDFNFPDRENDENMPS